MTTTLLNNGFSATITMTEVGDEDNGGYLIKISCGDRSIEVQEYGVEIFMMEFLVDPQLALQEFNLID